METESDIPFQSIASPIIFSSSSILFFRCPRGLVRLQFSKLFICVHMCVFDLRTQSMHVGAYVHTFVRLCFFDVPVCAFKRERNERADREETATESVRIRVVVFVLCACGCLCARACRLAGITRRVPARVCVSFVYLCVCV